MKDANHVLPPNTYKLVRNILERVIPRVESSFPLARKKEIADELKKALPGESIWVVLQPFNRNERQAFVYIEPNVRVIVRMTRLGKVWTPSSLKIPQPFWNTIWLG